MPPGVAALTESRTNRAARHGRYAAAMDLEEHTLETAGERCEECGAKLTEQELRTVLESGGPNLCAIHANEVVPVADDADTVGDDY